ncbi:MAG: ComEC/Rec2 family competence protein [Lacunisphaera sp.]
MPSPTVQLRAPLLWLLFPYMAGLAAARLWPMPACGPWPVIATALVLSALAAWTAFRPGKLNHGAWASCLCGAIALGSFALLHFREPQLHQWGNLPPREVALTVRVDRVYPDRPQARNVSGLGTIVAGSEADDMLIGRRVYFSALRRISIPPVRSGSYVFRGVIEPLPREPAPASFDDYLENLGIRQKLTRGKISVESSPPTALRKFCNRINTRFDQILSRGVDAHPEILSLYRAMLLGEKAAISPAQQNAFMRSGTFHIFSISGLHVGVIALVLHSVLRLLRLPRRLTVGLSLLTLGFYLEITGINSPAVRAFLMIAFLLASQTFRRPGNPLAALAGAALITLLIDPMQLFGAGFQMSYAVVTALVVMGLPLSKTILGRWRPYVFLPRPNWAWRHQTVERTGRWLLGSVCAGWVAFLASTPAGIGYFQLFSPGSLVANLIIVPLSSLAIVSGVLSLLVGLAGLSSLSALFNSSAAMTLIGVNWLAQRMTQLPGVFFGAHFRQPWFAPVAIVVMTACMFAGLGGGWSRRFGSFWPPLVLLAAILLFAVKFD